MRSPRAVQKSIAADVWPDGAVLECSACQKQQPITTEMAGAYLATGWPKCCGYTMRVEYPEKPEGIA